MEFVQLICSFILTVGFTWQCFNLKVQIIPTLQKDQQMNYTKLLRGKMTQKTKYKRLERKYHDILLPGTTLKKVCTWKAGE